jgi:hypothetical protein
MFRHWRIQQYWNSSKTPSDKAAANFNPSFWIRKGYTKDRQSVSNLRLGRIDTAGGFTHAYKKTNLRGERLVAFLLLGVCSARLQSGNERASPFPTFCPLSPAFCHLPAVLD